MKLIGLTLREFKGCKGFELYIDGGDINIFGNNSAGKTTLFDAYSWLWTDKDSLYRSDFGIKRLDDNNQPVHGLNHEVEGVFDVKGELTTLKKVHSEKWSKKRGSANKEFTGHKTDYYIDDVPVQKKEYDARIAEIVNEDVFRLLTNPRYFSEVLHWQDRRCILLAVCGDVSDRDVIASDDNLAQLPDILHNHKLTDYLRILAARRSKINGELKGLPHRIDEANRGLPEQKESREAIGDRLTKLQVAQKEKQREFVLIENGGGMAEKIIALQEVKAKLLGVEHEYFERRVDTVRVSKDKLNDFIDQIELHKVAIRQHQRTVVENNDEIVKLTASMQIWREEWRTLNAEQFIYPGGNTCPTCGQALPLDQVSAAQEEALALHNLRKAIALEEISTKGKRAAAECEMLSKSNEGIAPVIYSLKRDIAELEVKVDDLRQQVDELESDSTEYKALPVYKALTQEKDNLEQAIAELRIGSAGVADTIKEEIVSIAKAIEESNEDLARVNLRESGLQRIKELETQWSALSTEYEKLEREEHLCGLFLTRKVEMLESKINGKFLIARFKLFEPLINGGVEECCETLYDGVPYGSGLNNGAQINVGVDIINTLSEHYGISLPIWFDGAESITQIIKSRGQQIRLYVSKDDPVLRVEKENN